MILMYPIRLVMFHEARASVAGCRERTTSEYYYYAHGPHAVAACYSRKAASYVLRNRRGASIVFPVRATQITRNRLPGVHNEIDALPSGALLYSNLLYTYELRSYRI